MTTTTTTGHSILEWFHGRLEELYAHYDNNPPPEAVQQVFDERDAMSGRKPGEPVTLTDEERREALQTLHEIQRQFGDTSREELLAMLAEDDPSVCVDPTPYERELQSPASGSASTRTASS